MMKNADIHQKALREAYDEVARAGSTNYVLGTALIQCSRILAEAFEKGLNININVGRTPEPRWDRNGNEESIW